MLSFGVLSWMLYGRLLTMGHKSKGGIEHSHLDIPRNTEGSFLEECRGEFNNLLRIERSFPFSDDVKRCIVKCQMVRQLQSKLKGVKNQLIEIKNQLAEVEKQLTEVEKQATKVLKQLTEVEKQVTKVENQLIEVENQLKKSEGKPQKNSTEAV
jgi:predicted nuclease with TOPRIM domain